MEAPEHGEGCPEAVAMPAGDGAVGIWDTAIQQSTAKLWGKQPFLNYF